MNKIKQVISANIFLLSGKRVVIRRSSGALGDNLMLSFLAREIKRHYPDYKIAVETAVPELFINNPHVDRVYTEKVAAKYHKLRYKIDRQTDKHILDQIAGNFSLPLPEAQRKVDLFLEKSEISFAENTCPDKYIVICPEGKQSFAANRKEWDVNRFQELCEALSDYPIVQIGGANNALLNNVIDARGLPVRKSAALIWNSLTGVFLEGGLMHLANAVNKPSLVIFGGALSPNITGYDIHKNIATYPSCSPCITSHQAMEECDTMLCMKEITVDRVASAVRELIDNAQNHA